MRLYGEGEQSYAPEWKMVIAHPLISSIKKIYENPKYVPRLNEFIIINDDAYRVTTVSYIYEKDLIIISIEEVSKP